VKLVVPYPAGQATIAAHRGEVGQGGGQPVVIENIGGRLSGGSPRRGAARRYTLLMGTSAAMVEPVIDKLPYDPLTILIGPVFATRYSRSRTGRSRTGRRREEELAS
jgi:tripartite-type tricarboxylate transporter receptor subunit TctC